MYAPATAAQPAQTLAPVEVVSAAPASLGTPVRTALKVRHAALNVLEGHSATVTGTLREGGAPGGAGRLILLQARGHHGWKTIARGHTHAHGGFRIAYAPQRLISEHVRLKFAGNAFERPSRRALGRLNSYRLAGASWYGGGGGLACGGSLTSSTLGVANKTLPCGTMVTLRYHGRSIRVPVVDRGPYVAGREFDLTEATKRALGFGDTGEVWSTG
jgi:rare lipoprotein A